jgi:hypothetical protein
MSPSHAAATPMVARNVGKSVVAVSCDQSLRSEVSPMPMTVRFSQRGRARADVLGMFYGPLRRLPYVVLKLPGADACSMASG